MLINVTATLRRARHAVLNEQRKIGEQIRVLETALGLSTNRHGSVNSHRPLARRRHRMSAKARRALSKRMKSYWAAKRKETRAGTPKKKKS
jgi:hypothetical protein